MRYFHETWFAGGGNEHDRHLGDHVKADQTFEAAAYRFQHPEARHSLCWYEAKMLHARLDQALSELGGMQQPFHGDGTPGEDEAERAQQARSEDEIDDILSDFAAAFGRSISITRNDAVASDQTDRIRNLTVVEQGISKMVPLTPDDCDLLLEGEIYRATVNFIIESRKDGVVSHA